ncbi:GMC oxidoreductase [Bradyrhizobium brasilense]|uniref:GMC oxidoreductase n=1 Tax=Bradyrhizobium brasilense TaxID=1419277 RepID=UPI002877D627|nr:GMC oxidoreductase [Bradyrhizobium brasilense]MCP3415745.1 GMC oxidoreductase [Bradyrhizobium brasilense]
MGIYQTLDRQLKEKGIQHTTFSIDAIGSRICSSWDTVAAHRFDIVIIGAGMFGAYCAEKLFRRDTSHKLRILVLDAGPFFLPTHANNLPLREMDDGFVWARPWNGNDDYIKNSSLAFCVGGRSLFWAGWSPKLMPDDLARWPQAVRDFLNSPAGYDRTAAEIGSGETTDFIEPTETHTTLLAAFAHAKGKYSGGALIDSVEPAPLAVMGGRPTSGVFPFDQFSSATFLIDALNQDVNDSASNPWDRRLMLLPRAEVTGLRLDDKQQAVTSLDLEVAGDPKTLPLGPDTTVILANGTIEATRLALAHLGVGKQPSGPAKVGNFMAHMANSVIVRIRRSALGLDKVNKLDQVAALLVRGVVPGAPTRRFHYQVVAANLQKKEQTPWAFVMRLIPDIDELDRFITGRDETWISLVFRGIGEMEGDPRPNAANAWKSWISLEDDRAYANLIPSAKDDLLWTTMYNVAIELANKLAGNPKDLEYWWWSDKDWHPEPPPESRDGIGSSQHEGGTLFMGQDRKSSITDTDGKFHHLPNVYVVGPAVFPTIGDANPSLTGLTLARGTAVAILKARGITRPPPQPDLA